MKDSREGAGGGSTGSDSKARGGHPPMGCRSGGLQDQVRRIIPARDTFTHATSTKTVTVMYLSQHTQSRPPPPRWDWAVIHLYLKLRELIVLRSRCDNCFFWGQLILPQKSYCGYSPIAARKLQSLYTFLLTLHLLSCMKEVQFMSLFGVSYQLHSFSSNLANRILKMPRQIPSRFWHVSILWENNWVPLLGFSNPPPRIKLKLH